MKKTTSGFSIVELIVVIVVIAILATLATMSFDRIQTELRDSQRQGRVEIISDALEKYYLKNGEYPSCNQMTAPLSDVVTLIEVDPAVLSTPSDDSNDADTNSVICDTITTDGADKFAYIGAGCSVPAGPCSSFTLNYKEEISNAIKSIASRRQPSA